jgi:hypothetical protein
MAETSHIRPYNQTVDGSGAWKAPAVHGEKATAWESTAECVSPFDTDILRRLARSAASGI